MDVPIIEEIMHIGVGRARLAPRDRNPAGALTKHKGAHMEPLLKIMKSGCYSLTPEKDELAARKAEKEGKWYVARRKATYRMAGVSGGSSPRERQFRG